MVITPERTEMPLMLRLALTLLALFALTPPAMAAASVQNPNARVDLLAESASPRAGSTVTLGIRISAKPGWHSYWENPGESGATNVLTWTLPNGATAAPPRYPVPMTLVISGIMNYVYEGDATMLVDVAVPAGLAPGTALPIALKLDYLICSDELCVPENARLDGTLTIGDGTPDPTAAAAFATARAALPATLAAGARFERKGDRFRLSVPTAAPGDKAYFFALTDGAVSYSAPQAVTRSGDRLVIETAAGPNAALTSVEGILRIERPSGPPLGLALKAAPGPVPVLAAGGAAATPTGEGEGGLGLPLALLLAVGGGLLLNVMPCVFPILSLKALSLARAGGTETEARREALAYTAGIVLSVLALGGAILGLRAAGSTVGWAFQLQDPRVILVLLVLVTAIALNLAGLFEVKLGAVGGDSLAQKKGPAGAFWTGVLAAVVATPCTGPFMGAALGAALVLPPIEGLSIFAGLGFGLALPFLALGYIPRLRKLLPRPGAWMEKMKHILSVPMFLTALALAWVLGRQAGVSGMTLGIAAALAAGVGLWWLGSRQRGGGGVLAPIALGLVATIAAAASLTPGNPAAALSANADVGPLAGKPFSEVALAQARATGKPVFVYFTADWCITCKVNERGALSDTSVANAFGSAGVVTLVGDWTNGDEDITRFLAARGRSGVPLYIFYGPDGEERILPQLLTPGLLTELI